MLVLVLVYKLQVHVSVSVSDSIRVRNGRLVRSVLHLFPLCRLCPTRDAPDEGRPWRQLSLMEEQSLRALRGHSCDCGEKAVAVSASGSG